MLTKPVKQLDENVATMPLLNLLAAYSGGDAQAIAVQVDAVRRR
jgi:hypothetical protein